MKYTKNIILFLLPIFTMIGCASSKKTIIQSDQSQKYTTQAQLALSNESSLQALSILESAIKLDNSNPNLYIMQAQAYAQQKNLVQASASYDKAIKLAPKNGIYLSAKNTTICSLDTGATMADLNKTYNTALALEQSNEQGIAQINADKGNCLVTRGSIDDAIPLFESAMLSSNAPIDAYTGITKAYIEQGNYPKAALMINSVPNNEQNRQVMLLKIDALSGLLDKKYHISDKNRKILVDKISQLQQQLLQNQSNKTSKPIVVVDKTPEAINTPAALKNKPQVAPKPAVVKPATPATVPQSLPLETTKKSTASPVVSSTNYVQNIAFNKRIKKTSNGKKYIIIQHGDTLFNVSKQSGVSQEEIIKLNHLKNEFVPLNTKVYLN